MTAVIFKPIGTPEVLQIVGAGLELIGLLLVALGISDRRNLLWSNKPHFLIRLSRWSVGAAGNAQRWFRQRILRRAEPITVHPTSAALSIETAMPLTGFATSNWEGLSEAEVIDKIKQRLDAHRNSITALNKRVSEETDSRRAEIKSQDEKLPGLKDQLRELVKEAAAGDLGKDALGVFLFMVGVAVNLLGNLIQ